MKLLAIDPGSERSAWLLLEDGKPSEFGYESNEDLYFRLIQYRHSGWSAAVIESVDSYGMAVGREVFETVFWTGRYFEALIVEIPVVRLTRRKVKLHLCGTSTAKDANVRQALIDRFGGIGGKSAAIGTKAAPGPLYGVSGDVWAALAVAVAWADGARS
jgi:hypothetical protein